MGHPSTPMQELFCCVQAISYGYNNYGELMFTLSFFLPIFKSVHTYKGKMTMITNKLFVFTVQKDYILTTKLKDLDCFVNLCNGVE